MDRWRRRRLPKAMLPKLVPSLHQNPAPPLNRPRLQNRQPLLPPRPSLAAPSHRWSDNTAPGVPTTPIRTAKGFVSRWPSRHRRRPIRRTARAIRPMPSSRRGPRKKSQRSLDHDRLSAQARLESTLEVGSARYAMYSQGDGLWIKNAAEEDGMVAALRKGSDVTVKGVSAKGTEKRRYFRAEGPRPGARPAGAGLQALGFPAQDEPVSRLCAFKLAVKGLFDAA